MNKKTIIAAAVWLALGTLAAQATPSQNAQLSGSAVYSDPGFQEFVETSYGYLKPGSGLKTSSALRDAVASPAKTGKYVYVSVMVKKSDYAGLLSQLGASAGFKMSGERICRYRNAKTICIMGWMLEGSLGQVRKNPLVAKVSVEKPVK